MELFFLRKHNPISGFGKIFVFHEIFSKQEIGYFKFYYYCADGYFELTIYHNNLKIWLWVSFFHCFIGKSLTLLRSCSEIALVRAVVSMRPSSVSFWKYMGI